MRPRAVCDRYNTAEMVNNWLYAMACVLVPVAWGLLMVVVVGRAEKLVVRKRQGQEPPGSDEEPNSRGFASPEYYI